MKRLILFALLGLLVASCSTPRGLQPQDIPTRASINDISTSVPLTENAPPAPINGLVTDFNEIDNHLTDLPGWRYVVQLEFTGVFANTPREASASARAEVWFNQLASARRVQVSTSGDLLGQPDNSDSSAYEAVRLGPDAFLVRDGTCQSNATEAAKTAANLRAGELVGGVTRATPGGRHATINGTDVYLFTFDGSDLILPSIRIGDNGSVTLTSGELWLSAENNVAVRFYLNLDVENVVIFDRQLPVSGQVLMRYDLYDVGTEFNITTPFGC